MNSASSPEVTQYNSRATKEQLKVFRFKEIKPVACTGQESFWITDTEVKEKGFKNLVDAGWLEGVEFRELIDVPGFNLAHGRLKPNFTIPLHRHEGSAVYLILNGTLHYGDIALNAGDGLFQPTAAPYTVTSGDQGCELLEMRNRGGVDTYFVSGSERYWAAVLEHTVQARPTWSKGWPGKFGQTPL